MSLSILVVDDSKALRRIMVNMLEKLGHSKIIEAENGEVGIAKMSRFAPDLVFMDWEMPEMKGITALEKIKRDKKLKETPVVMVTTVGDKAKIVRAVQAGASGYIIKPFNAEMIESKINEVFAEEV